MMSKTRLFYFDVLKAIAIFSVVLGHVCLFDLDNPLADNVTRFVGYYQLPVFFLVSGYFINWDTFRLSKRLLLFIPFVFWGLICTYSTNGDWIYFFTSKAKVGYWFIWTLLLFNSILSLLRIGGGKLSLYKLIFVWIIFIGLHALFRGMNPIGLFIGTDNAWLFWPSFSLGMLLRNGLLEKITKFELHTFIVCALISLAYIVCDYSFALPIALTKPLSVVVGLLISVAMLLAFRWLDLRHNDEKVKRGLIYKIGSVLGQYTLQIYMLHYLFVFHVNLDKVDLLLPNWWAIHLTFYLAITFILCMACIAVAKLIEKAGLSILFGTVKKKLS